MRRNYTNRKLEHNAKIHPSVDVTFIWSHKNVYLLTKYSEFVHKDIANVQKWVLKLFQTVVWKYLHMRSKAAIYWIKRLDTFHSTFSFSLWCNFMWTFDTLFLTVFDGMVLKALHLHFHSTIISSSWKCGIMWNTQYNVIHLLYAVGHWKMHGNVWNVCIKGVKASSHSLAYHCYDNGLVQHMWVKYMCRYLCGLVSDKICWHNSLSWISIFIVRFLV